MQIDLKQLSQKIRDRSTPPKASLSRSPIATSFRSKPFLNERNKSNPKEALCLSKLISFSNKKPNDISLTQRNETIEAVETKCLQSELKSPKIFLDTKPPFNKKSSD
jgi:hypothetical protein